MEAMVRIWTRFPLVALLLGFCQTIGADRSFSGLYTIVNAATRRKLVADTQGFYTDATSDAIPKTHLWRIIGDENSTHLIENAALGVRMYAQVGLDREQGFFVIGSETPVYRDQRWQIRWHELGKGYSITNLKSQRAVSDGSDGLMATLEVQSGSFWWLISQERDEIGLELAKLHRQCQLDGDVFEETRHLVNATEQAFERSHFGTSPEAALWNSWFGFRDEAPNNLASTMGQLQDFLNGKPVKGQCPEAEPVLAIAMPVNLKEANGLSELFLPMLIRAARSSVSTMMQVPDQVISVTLSHPVETRLLSMQETVEQAEKGSKFNIVAEVSSPPQEAMQAAMGSQFLEDFQEEVSAALIREGAEAGTGNFHQIAQFDTPVLEEKSSLDVEGFKSEGFGTVCETYRQKQLQPGEVEEKQVGSVRACAQACAGSKGCQGFQFGHAQKTCKLWKTGVCRSQEAVSPLKLECYRKCAT